MVVYSTSTSTASEHEQLIERYSGKSELVKEISPTKRCNARGDETNPFAEKKRKGKKCATGYCSQSDPKKTKIKKNG